MATRSKKSSRRAETRLGVKAAAVHACADRPGGNIDPKRVVKVARNPKHPLHNEFEWNDGKAAEKYRLITAKEIIREVRFMTMHQTVQILVPYYVSDPQKRGTYAPTARIANRVDIANAVLKRELDQIESSIIRAQSLSVAFGLREQLDAMLIGCIQVRTMIDDEERPVRRRKRQTESPPIAPA